MDFGIAQRANTFDAHRPALAGRARGRPGRHEGTAAPGLLHRGRRRRRPRRAGAPGGRGRPATERGRGLPRLRRGRRRGARGDRSTAWSGASPPSRRSCSRASGPCPAPRTRDTMLAVLTARAATAPAEAPARRSLRRRAAAGGGHRPVAARRGRPRWPTRSVRTRTTRTPPLGQRRGHGGTDLGGRLHLHAAARRGPRRRRADRRRGACRTAARTAPAGTTVACGRNEKMPPPSLSTTTIVRSTPRPASAEQPVGVVQERDVTDQQRGRAPEPRATPDGGRHHAVDAVGAAVGDAPARRRGARRTTRRRGPASTTRRRARRRRAARRPRREPPAAPSARRGRPATAAMAACALASARAQRAAHGVPRRPAQPLGQRRGTASWDRRSPRTAAVCSGSVQVPAGVDLHLAGAGAGEPLARAPSTPAAGPAAARPSGCGRRRSARGASRSSKAADRRGRGSRQPERGSASTGQPVAAARACTTAGSPAPCAGDDDAPLLVEQQRPARPACAAGSAAGDSTTRCHGAPPGRPSGSGPGSPTSGSRKGRLRWTGPGRSPVASATARAPSERHVVAIATSGTPGSWNQRTAVVKRRSWSIVCGAPTSRSSGGRSAVQTRSGTSAWWASTTAGCSSAAAVPLLHTSTAGRPVASPRPSAMKAAERSSWWTWSRRRGSAASASASGVTIASRERQPRR